METNQLLTVLEAAEVLALKPATLRKWILDRRMPYVKLGGRSVRVPQKWVQEQIQQGWREPVSPGEKR